MPFCCTENEGEPVFEGQITGTACQECVRLFRWVGPPHRGPKHRVPSGGTRGSEQEVNRTQESQAEAAQSLMTFEGGLPIF